MKLVVAIDGVQSAEAALAYVLKFKFDKDTQIHLVHVLVPGFADMSVAGIPDPAAEERAEEQRLLAQMAQRLNEEIAAAVTTEILEGEVAEIVARVCRDFHADEAIVPSHARHGLSRLWYGSIAKEVVDAAPCTVVVPKISSSVAP